MLALVRGRYPSSPDQVALTDGVAASFRTEIGDTFDLDGRQRTVVGLVENPSDLSMEFALVSPADDAIVESVTLLVGGSKARFEDFPASTAFQSDDVTRTSRAKAINYVAAAATVGVAQLGLVLVALMAAASFAAVAQRRLQQLGMLASIGATQRHLRLVVVANGAVLGVVAATLGGALGVLGWVAFAPLLENAAGYRIAATNLPWILVAATMVLAVVAATAAAWWPARTVAKVSITDALSGRPQPPAPARQSAGSSRAVRRHRRGLLCSFRPDQRPAPRHRRGGPRRRGPAPESRWRSGCSLRPPADCRSRYALPCATSVATRHARRLHWLGSACRWGFPSPS